MEQGEIMMVNRNTNQLHGLFGFPFFTRPQQTLSFQVEDKDKELVIDVISANWKKESISLEVVQNGLFLAVVEKGESDEDSDQEIPQLNEQRFFPVNFPFTENDVSATFDDEEKKLTVIVQKSEVNRKFIKIN